MIYVTSEGDMWDKIAYEQMGSENFMGELIRNNDDLVDVVVFHSGVEINVPEVDDTQTDLPSWRSGLDDETDGLDEFEEDEDE